MPKAIFVQPLGEISVLEVTPGESLMQAAKRHGLDGIVGDCGGSMSCATCHVFVDEADWPRVGPPGATEEGMLEFTATDRREYSRLSCQLVMTDGLDGLTVHLPQTQL